MTEITLKSKIVSLLFFSIVVFLTLVHSVVTVLSFYLEDNSMIAILIELFDLDLEDNIPTFYSAFAIFLNALLFYIIARAKTERLNYEKLCWFGLSGIFFFLAIDEILQIHEIIGDFTEEHVQATGFIYFPWVVPYIFALLIIGGFYLKFLLILPKKTVILLIFSAAVFLTGAVVLDMLGGREAELHGYESVTYYVLYTIEEFLEMTGMVLLMFTLLSYIENQWGLICISLRFKNMNEVCEHDGTLTNVQEGIK